MSLLNNKEIKESLFKTIDRLDNNQKMENEYEKLSTILISNKKNTKIDYFTGYFSFLSNNYLTPVYHDGIIFQSVLHAYYANKTEDKNIHKKILNCENFQNLLSLAYRIKDPENWENKKFQIMEKLVRDKFRRNKEISEKLILTENRELINTLLEYNEKNLFWGVYKGKGENNLGRILTKIREDLIYDKKNLFININEINNNNNNNDNLNNNNNNNNLFSHEIINWINNSFNLVNDFLLLPIIKFTIRKNNTIIDHIELKGKNLYKIGKLSCNDIILHNVSVSRFHAVLIIDEKLGIILIDLNSKYGTKINNIKIKPNVPYKLSNGKKISFGLSSREFDIEIDITDAKKVFFREKEKILNKIDLVRNLNINDSKNLNKTFNLNENENNRTIFIKNIPFEANEKKIIEIFSKFGKIIKLEWPRNVEGFKKSFCFLKFEKCESAKDAVEYGLISYETEEKEYLDWFDNKKIYTLKVEYANSYKYNKFKVKEGMRKDYYEFYKYKNGINKFVNNNNINNNFYYNSNNFRDNDFKNKIPFNTHDNRNFIDFKNKIHFKPDDSIYYKKNEIKKEMEKSHIHLHKHHHHHHHHSKSKNSHRKISIPNDKYKYLEKYKNNYERSRSKTFHNIKEKYLINENNFNNIKEKKSNFNNNEIDDVDINKIKNVGYIHNNINYIKNYYKENHLDSSSSLNNSFEDKNYDSKESNSSSFT